MADCVAFADTIQKQDCVVDASGTTQHIINNDADSVSTSDSSGRAERVKHKTSKEERKAARKVVKAAAREKRSADPKDQRKPCELCQQPQVLLYRCRIDASAVWRMVCPVCWPGVSGGVADGDAAHPHYRYGGTWKLFKR